jgi:hypothetical protein
MTNHTDAVPHPAAEQFGMFDWNRLDAITEVGYECARDALDRWHMA